MRDHIFFIMMVVITLLAIISFRSLAIAPAALFLIFSFLLWSNKETLRDTFPHWSFITIGSIITLSAISLFWATSPEWAETRLLKMLPLFLLGGGFLWVCRYVSFEFKPWVAPLFLAICALFYSYELYNNFSAYRLLRGMDAEAYVNPSEYNRYLCYFTLLVLLFLAKIKSSTSGLLLLFSGASAYFVTESQSAQLGLLAGVCVYAFYPYIKAWMGRVILTGTIIVTLFKPWIVPTLYENRPQTMGDYFEVNASGYQRLEVWDSLSRYIQQKPVIGYGVEATREIPLNIENLYFRDDTILHPHNFVLQLWIEWGLLGVITFIVLFTCLIKKLEDHHTDTQQRIAYSLIMAVFAIGYTGYGIWQGWFIGALFITAGLYRILYKEESVLTCKK